MKSGRSPTETECSSPATSHSRRSGPLCPSVSPSAAGERMSVSCVPGTWRDVHGFKGRSGGPRGSPEARNFRFLVFPTLPTARVDTLIAVGQRSRILQPQRSLPSRAVPTSSSVAARHNPCSSARAELGERVRPLSHWDETVHRCTFWNWIFDCDGPFHPSVSPSAARNARVFFFRPRAAEGRCSSVIR